MSLIDFGDIHTMWKFQYFSITQILRQINFWDTRSSKTASFAILGAVNFVHLVNISLQKVQKFIKSKFTASKCDKMADFALQEFSKWISCKIPMIQKS